MFGFPGYMLPGEALLPVQFIGGGMPHAQTIGRYLPGMDPQNPYLGGDPLLYTEPVPVPSYGYDGFFGQPFNGFPSSIPGTLSCVVASIMTR